MHAERKNHRDVQVDSEREASSDSSETSYELSHQQHAAGTSRNANARHDPAHSTDVMLHPRREAPLHGEGQDSGESSTIIKFLNGLCMPLPQLYPLFKRMGIDDERALQGFKRLRRRSEWMANWCKDGDLTLLQQQIIEQGLDELSQPGAW